MATEYNLVNAMRVILHSCKNLSDAGFQMNSFLNARRSGHGYNALAYAVETGRTEIVAMLLEAGADTDIVVHPFIGHPSANTRDDAHDLKMLARRSEHPEIVELIENADTNRMEAA